MLPSCAPKLNSRCHCVSKWRHLLENVGLQKHWWFRLIWRGASQRYNVVWPELRQRRRHVTQNRIWMHKAIIISREEKRGISSLKVERLENTETNQGLLTMKHHPLDILLYALPRLFLLDSIKKKIKQNSLALLWKWLGKQIDGFSQPCETTI